MSQGKGSPSLTMLGTSLTSCMGESMPLNQAGAHMVCEPGITRVSRRFTRLGHVERQRNVAAQTLRECTPVEMGAHLCWQPCHMGHESARGHDPPHRLQEARVADIGRGRADAMVAIAEAQRNRLHR